MRPLDLGAAAGDFAGNVEGAAAAESPVVHTSGAPHGSEAPSEEKPVAAGLEGLGAVEERLNGEDMVEDVVG